MNTIPNSPVLQAISAATQKADNAYMDIADATIPKGEIGNDTRENPGDLFQPITSLSEAENQHSAAVKALKIQQENSAALMGYIFDEST